LAVAESEPGQTRCSRRESDRSTCFGKSSLTPFPHLRLCRDAFVIRAKDRQVLGIVEQERVVPVRGDDFRVAHVAIVVDERLTISRERAGAKRQSVVKDTTRNRQVAGASACARSPPVAVAGSK
jgi:hypothetical protein